MTPAGESVFSLEKKVTETEKRESGGSWKTCQVEREIIHSRDRQTRSLACPVLRGVTGVCLYDSHGVKNVPHV